MENKALQPDGKQMAHKEFLIKLQLEYLTHKLRAQIYRDERFAKVAEDISNKKKDKIQELGAKFGLKTIFDGIDPEKFVMRYFWCPVGLPLFQYKDPEQRRVQSNYDRWYLLYRGTIVGYKGVDAVVVLNDPSKEEVKIRISEREFFVKYSEITIKMNYKWN